MIRGFLLKDSDLAAGNQRKTVWRIGTPATGVFDAEFVPGGRFGFVPLTAPLCRVTVPSGGVHERLEGMPDRITSDCAAHPGVETLELATDLPRGVYTLCLDILETVENDFCVVSLDGAEIGAFAVPYAGNIDVFGKREHPPLQYPAPDYEDLARIHAKYEISKRYESRERQLRVFRFVVPFAATTTGRHTLSITNLSSHLGQTIMAFNGDGFAPVAYTLFEGLSPEALPVETALPDRPLVPVWGWMSMTNFDHPGNRVTPPAELIQRSIHESFQWGANNLEFLPVNHDGMALELGEDAWDGKELYRKSGDTIWTGDAVKSVIRAAHQHGMIAEFFIYCLHGAGFINRALNCRQKINMLEQIARKYANLLSGDAVEQADGLIAEAWFPVDGPAYTRAAWKWNPAFFLFSSINDGAQYDMINAGFSPAMHHYSAHWHGPVQQHTGFDHCYPLLPYPLEFYEKKEGTIHTYMQACGQTGHLRRNFPVIYWADYGLNNRTVSPDWIVAQAHNFALRQLLCPADRVAMALCWEADEQTMAPLEARRYIYAASQDPVRLAAAFRLQDSGAGGEIDLKRATRRVLRQDTSRLRERHPFPATTTALQNRHLQLLLCEGRDFNVLQADLSATATFYNHGPLVRIGMPFAATRFPDARFLDKKIEIIESAGPRSVVVEKSRMGSGYLSLEQTATYTVHSEIPAVRVDIARAIEPGITETVDTFFAFLEYDTVTAAGEKMMPEKTAAIPSATFTLSDSTGLLPETLFSVQADRAVIIEFVKNQGVFIRQPLLSSHRVRVDVAMRLGRFTQCSEEAIWEQTRAADLEACFDDQGFIEVRNDRGADMVHTLRIGNPGDAPCFTRENGWWRFRGLTPSQERPGTSCLRLNVAALTTSVVRRHGFIHDALRPGRGCQYLLAFSQIEREGGRVSFLVNSQGGNPMMPAPRIELAEEIRSVAIDGQPWHYFSAREIALPAPEGQYRVEAEWGACQTPRIISAFASVVSTAFADGVFRARFANPPWARMENSETPYAAVLEIGDAAIASAFGCRVANRKGARVLIEFQPGEIALTLG